MDYLKNAVAGTQHFFSALSVQRRIVVLSAVVLTIVSLIALISWASRVEYKVLYSGLSTEDAGVIVTRLKDQKIPYKIGRDGNSILVPATVMYEVRMNLASEGLPQSSGIGYEIFDKQSIGVTEFMQKVNYRRALQGELARTIKQFHEVRNARVHLSIPEKKLFQDDQEKTRASVVVTLFPGKTLQPGQIQGITHLLANSVEGLDPDNVSIVDSHGKLITGGKERAELSDVTSTQQEMEIRVGTRLTGKIESMLGSVVGPDKVTARVAVEMDFTQVEQTEENYDPDKAAVRSEQRSSEKSSGRRPLASGVPGVMTNTPDISQAGGADAGVKSTDYNKSDETVNYEISRITRRTVNRVGSINRITAAVLIDGTYTMVTNEAGQEVKTYVPRTAEEMNKFETLVRQAIGFDESRGDSVEVVNVQFQETAAEIEKPFDRFLEILDWQSIIKYAITALLIAIFLIFGFRPLANSLSMILSVSKSREELAAAPGEGRRVEELPEGVFKGDLALAGEKQTNLVGFAKKNPRLFAQYLKNWLQ